MLLKLEKLFSKIFKIGHYPSSWNEEIILSVHKSGEEQNINTFRGATLSENWSNLVSSILYNRLSFKF